MQLVQKDLPEKQIKNSLISIQMIPSVPGIVRQIKPSKSLAKSL
jgi:hypothetical protein